MTSLTVSIVNYKTPQLVIECINSLKRFAPRLASMRVIVVDNASADDSLALIGAAHSDVQLIDAGDNLGFAAGNNLALQDCESDYVLLLNSDALVDDGSLDHLLQVMQNNPQVGAVSARVVNADDGQDQDYPARFPSLLEMFRRALSGPQFPAHGQQDPVVMERLHGACMLIRSKLLNSVGLLDDGFFMYDEDVDWCVRARQQGWQLWLIPQARVLHHGGRSSGRSPSGRASSPTLSPTALRMRYELRRSRYRLYRKHRTGWELLLLKLCTDTAMLLACVRPALHYLTSQQRKEALALLQANLKIIALNPFDAEAP
ncbi:glycosyltransferase family 2 protein [Atopomonas hussainii]|uniref:glycosyltransferase family 2 protein n=1 Tax=Atopomonas hussainii TaxID=1429083 RepID=UPI0008FFF28C|nr:glycosyltransferase family 2 protein [Atopomonas hussainii]